MFDSNSMDKGFVKLINGIDTALLEVDGIGENCDLIAFSDKFFTSSKTTTADITSDPNSNVGRKDIIRFHNEKGKGQSKLHSYYELWVSLKEDYGMEYANKIITEQISGNIYIHDVHGISDRKPYCFNYSTYDIMIQGLPMVDGIKSIPPKSLMAFKHQVEQFTIIAANSTLGATGLADFLICYSYYVDKILKNDYKDHHIQLKDEKAVWEYAYENIVAFIYTINQPSRGDQSCFTNVSLYDMPSLVDLQDNYIDSNGKTIVNPDIAMRVQELFMLAMSEEMKRTPITFPVTTACVSLDDNGAIRDEDFVKLCAKYNNLHGWMNYFTNKNTVLSSCCRLRSETTSEYFNSFGAGSTKIGSLGVVTINLPRLAIEAKRDFNSFLVYLEEKVNDSAKINNAKRKIINKAIKSGFCPLYDYGFMDIKKQYSTTGIVGFNESLEILGYDITSEEGVEYALKIINTINSVNKTNEKKYKFPHNCEQVPAENVSHKLPTKDKICLGKENCEKYILYSNQFIPLTKEANLLERIRLQGIFDKHFTGGAIAHFNVDGQVSVDDEILLIKHCAEQGVIYWARNANLAFCENGHFNPSPVKASRCSVCNGTIKGFYTRVVGFLTPVSAWHEKRRKHDYPERKFYNNYTISGGD